MKVWLTMSQTFIINEQDKTLKYRLEARGFVQAALVD